MIGENPPLPDDLIAYLHDRPRPSLLSGIASIALAALFDGWPEGIIG